MASQQGSNLTGNGAKPADDDDELLLLSSPSPSSDDLVKSNLKRDALPTNKKSKRSPSTHDIVNVEEDLDLEILEEVTSIPEASLSGSNSESESSEEEEEDLEEEDDEEEDDESMSLEGGKINIQYSQGSFFLWDAEDVQMLRDECRIVGKLVGCLPRAPRQNIQLGLPLQLMPEEARLLVDIDAAALVVEKPVSDSTLKARKAAFDNVRQQNFQIQQRLYKEHRKEEVGQRMDSIIAGKKAKKRKLQEEGNQSDQTSEDSVTKEVEDKNSSSAIESKEKTQDEEIDNLTVDDIVKTETSEEHALVQIFTQIPWKQSFMPFKNWTYPSTERDVLRYLVFKDLWGKGFFLTSGAKFGGDFLVYPGDPSRYHSHYIAVCRSQFDEMPCLDLVSLGRLSSNVRKTALLCALDRNRKVTYTSLTWTGIS